MLTVDLVRARRQDGELRLSAITPKLRDRCLILAEAYISLARNHLQCTREALEQAWQSVDVRPSERKLALGLRKLVEDRCEFDVDTPLPPIELRRTLFAEATRLRRGLPDHQTFDRSAFLQDQARQLGVDVDGLERALYADLRHAQLLQRMAPITAEQIVDRYEPAQVQAVLLRAIHLRAQVQCRDAHTYRQLFHKLKFLRLLHQITPLDGGGYRIDIDGPFSLFGPVTKYGLQLALAVPALQACDRWSLDASIRWGREREPLRFHCHGSGKLADEVPRLPDEIDALLAKLRAMELPWQVEPSSDILPVAGVGLCVPDLKFVHRKTGEVAYLEVLGYWSRQAVWRRVELAEAGLPHRIVFAASKRLRVDESVLDETPPAALYMYKGVMSPREVLRRLEATRSPA